MRQGINMINTSLKQQKRHQGNRSESIHIYSDTLRSKPITNNKINLVFKTKTINQYTSNIPWI